MSSSRQRGMVRWRCPCPVEGSSPKKRHGTCWVNCFRVDCESAVERGRSLTQNQIRWNGSDWQAPLHGGDESMGGKEGEGEQRCDFLFWSGFDFWQCIERGERGFSFVLMFTKMKLSRWEMTQVTLFLLMRQSVQPWISLDQWKHLLKMTNSKSISRVLLALWFPCWTKAKIWCDITKSSYRASRTWHIFKHVHASSIV